MIARARAVAHGNAYTTYATLKKDAEFVCSENMAGDMSVTMTDGYLDDIWMQFKYAGENYIAKGKPSTFYILHSNLHRWGKCGENFVFVEK